MINTWCRDSKSTSLITKDQIVFFKNIKGQKTTNNSLDGAN
jgi:hypothetical protein